MTRFTLISIVVFTLFSCKKENNSTDENSIAIITDAMWKLSSSIAVSTYTGGSFETDLLDGLPVCKTDNLFQFNPNNTFTIDEGATKCSPSDPQVRANTGTWSVSNNIMTITDSSNPAFGTLTAEIISISSSSFTLRYVTTGSGITSTTTTVYIKV